MGRKTEAPRQTEQLDQSLNTSTHHAVRVTQRKCTLRRSVPGSNAFVPMKG